ncbi:MAG: hypothetical protein WA688_08275 [Thermoplasmata archaeon]
MAFACPPFSFPIDDVHSAGLPNYLSRSALVEDWDDRCQLWDFPSIEEVVHRIAQSTAAESTGEVYNPGQGSSVRVTDAVGAIRKFTGKSVTEDSA